MFEHGIKPGDPVIYRRWKRSSAPGPRAASIQPAQNGDDYYYLVDKYWLVDRILENGRLLLRTRRGKTHVVDADDCNLRKPTWWERLRCRSRFPKHDLERADSADGQASS